MPKARGTATVGDVCAAMDSIAPAWLAADWDNVGLLTGAPDWPAIRILLTIDLTPAVANEAVAKKTNVVISYHPPIFRAAKSMRPSLDSPEGIAAELLSRRIAVYSPHTALDGAEGGTNETLARMAGLMDLRPFTAAAPTATQSKIVVFVPADAVERVAGAMFDAGAGVIGEYARCSFRLDGVGTFLGGETTNPTVGRKQAFEKVPEVRLESIAPARRVADITAAIRRAHPYEEPAFDIYPLQTPVKTKLGQGRIGHFDSPVRLGDLAKMLATKTQARSPVFVGNPKAKLRRGFVCAGSAGTLPFETDIGACGAGDVVITGEVRHHDALRFERTGAAVIALGHTASERPVLKVLRQQLMDRLDGADVSISKRDKEPIEAIR